LLAHERVRGTRVVEFQDKVHRAPTSVRSSVAGVEAVAGLKDAASVVDTREARESIGPNSY
jgi:hypothetical protein